MFDRALITRLVRVLHGHCYHCLEFAEIFEMIMMYFVVLQILRKGLEKIYLFLKVDSFPLLDLDFQQMLLKSLRDKLFCRI